MICIDDANLLSFANSFTSTSSSTTSSLLSQQAIPVVALLGHYNHGKTTLLEALLDTTEVNIVDSEAHQITQVCQFFTDYCTSIHIHTGIYTHTHTHDAVCTLARACRWYAAVLSLCHYPTSPFLLHQRHQKHLTHPSPRKKSLLLTHQDKISFIVCAIMGRRWQILAYWLWRVMMASAPRLKRALEFSSSCRWGSICWVLYVNYWLTLRALCCAWWLIVTLIS